MEEAAFQEITARVIALADRGELDECERVLIDQLAQVRGEDVQQELQVLGNLASIYGRVGRVFESLLLSRRAVQMARSSGDEYREARALTGICTGRIGLRVDVDLSADVERLRELMDGFPIRDDTRVLHMEAAFVEFSHALNQDDLESARAHLDRFGMLAEELDREKDLTALVQLAGRAVLALRRDAPERALELLDEIDERGVASPFHMPELAVLRVEARVALGDLETARREADAALVAIQGAPPSAFSESIHFGARLADAFAGPLDDVGAAARAYDAVATAVFARIKQIDECIELVPELGTMDANNEADLVRYRRSFMQKQQITLRRVAEMFRSQERSELRRFVVDDEAEGLIAICAWCEAVRDDTGRWIGIGHLVPREGPYVITHGICPRCSDTMS